MSQQRQRYDDVDDYRIKEDRRESKRLKTTTECDDDVKNCRRLINDGHGQQPQQPIQSKKALRAAKKAALKNARSEDNPSTTTVVPLTPEEAKAEKIHRKKEERKLYLKEQQALLVKQLRKEKKLRQQKKLRREMNAPGRGVKAINVKRDSKTMGSAKCDDATSCCEDDRDLNIFRKVFEGSSDDITGMTTLRLGVQYTDVVVGTGAFLQDKMAVTVKYRLTGGKFGQLLDSSNKFTFRFGKGEVIQGWDIGLQGMRVGGRRKLIVPPKAGYGSQDIGAGAGAVLHFDISLLSY